MNEIEQRKLEVNQCIINLRIFFLQLHNNNNFKILRHQRRRNRRWLNKLAQKTSIANEKRRRREGGIQVDGMEFDPSDDIKGEGFEEVYNTKVIH
jgi:hypothetical protein